MTCYCGLGTREERPERAVQRSGLEVRALHPKPVLTPPTLNLPDPRMDLCRIQSRLSLGQGREGGRGSEGAVWMLLMDSCSWLAAPCAVLENERAWSRPQNAAKPLVQGGRKGLELYSSKGHEGKKPSMCFFFPSAFLCFLSPCPEEAVDYNFSAVGDAKLNGAGLSIFVLCALSDEITWIIFCC